MKAIYKPTGKAGEYSEWACNLYNGCSHGCLYCYNDHGIMRETLGGLNVRLKKSLVNPGMAYKIFCEELNKYKEAVIAEGRLHFNFVSDPCLPETIELNWKCIDYAISQKVPCQVLTKRADWLGHPCVQNALTNHPELLFIGFSLTGCDEQEPGASTNEQRILAMRELHGMGISTWASCEPIIDPARTLEMIRNSIHFCNHFKVGILSGKKVYSPQDVRELVQAVNALNPRSVYWKQSLREFIMKP